MSPLGLLLILYHFLWVLVVGKASNTAFHAEDDGCNAAPAYVQCSVLLQTVHIGNRLQKEDVEMNVTLDRPHSEHHAVKSALSFAGLWDHLSSLQSTQRFFFKLIFGSPTLTHYQKILLGIFFGIAIASALIWASFVYLSDRWRSANASSDQQRLPRQMDTREWEEAVKAYRHVMTGKNSRTVIRGNGTPQPQESAILKASIAQAKLRDGTAASSSSHGMQAAEAKARELRAQAAIARQSQSSQVENCLPDGAASVEGNTLAALSPTTEEEAEWLGAMHSMDDDDPSLGGNDFAPDHLGPKTCKYFRS